jgi:hypothetical protein
VTTRSKMGVGGYSVAGIVGSTSAGGMDVCLVCVACCQVEICASGCSLVQRSPAECDVCSENRVKAKRYIYIIWSKDSATYWKFNV